MNRADKASRTLAAPKAIRLRARARALKSQSDALLKKADALLAEAERAESAQLQKKTPREDFNQAAARVVREATEKI
jgi:hypothetical protein